MKIKHAQLHNQLPAQSTSKQAKYTVEGGTTGDPRLASY
jgi:hypothetical protein